MGRKGRAFIALKASRSRAVYCPKLGRRQVTAVLPGKAVSLRIESAAQLRHNMRAMT